MSQFPGFTGGYSIPGMNTVLEGVENQFWFGRVEQQVWLPDTISGAARDAANTDPTLLRSGLLLGKITSSGLLKEWNPGGVDGSEVIHSLLGGMIHAQQSGSNQQRYVGFIMVGGNLYSDRIIIPGNAAEGIVGDALEFEVIAQLRRRFLLDRHLTQLHADPSVAMNIRYMTAAEDTADAYTVLTSDNGKHFVNFASNGTAPSSGTPLAATFTAQGATTVVTLPAATRGLAFTFSSIAAQTQTLTAVGSDKIASSGTVTGTTYSLTSGKSVTLIGMGTNLWQAIAIG